MLRLNPTQIWLDKKDLDWHIPRHVDRQAERAAAPRLDISKQLKRMTPKQQRKIGFPDASPSPKVPLSAKYSDRRSGPDTEIFSDDPIPHQDRGYWDTLLAQAGTPLTLQTAPTARVTVVDPTHDFLDSTHSARASIEQISILMSEGQDNEQSTSCDDPTGSPSSSDSSKSIRDSGTFAEMAEQEPPSEELTQSPPSGQRQTWSLFRRGPRKTTEEPHGIRALLGHVTHSLSGSMAVDGPSDRHSRQDRNSSRSFSGDMGRDLKDGLYGNRRDRRTFSGAASREDRALEHPESSTYRLPTRTALPPPRAIGHSRNMSGNLPRSSLYISEAAVSSSPERRPRTPPDSHSNASESQGLLSLPPRRPRVYRPRSQTYSYAESEDFPTPAVPQMDGPSSARGITNRLPSVLVCHIANNSDLFLLPSRPTSGTETPVVHTNSLSLLTQRSTQVSHAPIYPETSTGGSSASHQLPTFYRRDSNHRLTSSSPPLPANRGQILHASPTSPYSIPSTASPQEPIEIRSYRSNSSIYSSHSRAPSAYSPINSSAGLNNDNHSTLYRRNLSPNAAPFIPQSVRRSVSPQLFLPPPFSATSRNVSISSTYPPSSPASPHTPPQRQLSATVSPSIAPTSRRIQVYNDRLSPSTQPQTPAGLPRHGVPAMATTNPFNTAPIGGLRRASALAHWQAFATPTRRPSARARNNRGFGMPPADQENEGRITELGRGARRESRRDSWALQLGERGWGTPTP